MVTLMVNLSRTMDHLLERIVTQIGCKLEQLWVKSEQRVVTVVVMAADFGIVHGLYLTEDLQICRGKKKQGRTQKK